jgi:FixJ family two-component response regulator
VCDSAVFQAIRTLRVAVGESREQIVTVRGRGYRFDGVVTEVDELPAPRPSIQEPNRRLGSQYATRRTVLIVDDDQEIVDALTRTLRGLGCRLLSATSGCAALVVMAREPVDLIVSDVDMPFMSGLELIARVRTTHPHALRLILTGVASLPVALRAINDGEVYRFLTKPWDNDQLRQVIREAIPLSPRLRQTLTELMSGAPEKEIAHRLRVSPHTAHQYIKTIYRRFDVASRVQLMVKVEAHRDAAAKTDPALRRVGS